MKEAPVDSAALKAAVEIKSPYTFRDSAEHQCIIIINAKKLDINDFKLRVSNFNLEYFSLSDLLVSNVLMDPDHHIVNIGKFPLAAKAKDYYDLINQDAKVFKDIEVKDYQVFPISTDNYNVLYQTKKIEEYKKFFKEFFIDRHED